MQLAKAEGVKLLLQLVAGIAVQVIPRAASMLRRRPHEHLRVRLARTVLGSPADLCRLVGRLPLLGGATLALKLLCRRLRWQARALRALLVLIPLFTYLNACVSRFPRTWIMHFRVLVALSIAALPRPILTGLVGSIRLQPPIQCGFCAAVSGRRSTVCIRSRGHFCGDRLVKSDILFTYYI